MAWLNPICRPFHEEGACGRAKRTAAPVDRSMEGSHQVSEIGWNPVTPGACMPTGSRLAGVDGSDVAGSDLPGAVIPS
jgi:hypothetical protein